MIKLKKYFEAVRKVLLPQDLIPILVIIFGLVLGIAISEQAIRLIGASLTILGVVALFMLISQRLKTNIELRNKPGVAPPKFQITETKDSGAKRQIFEDYETYAADDNDKATEQAPETINPTIAHEEQKEDKRDEGFTILAKKTVAKQRVEEVKPMRTFGIADSDKKQQDNSGFPDNYSGMRIIGPASKAKKTDSQPEVLQKDEPEMAASTATQDNAQKADEKTDSIDNASIHDVESNEESTVKEEKEAVKPEQLEIIEDNKVKQPEIEYKKMKTDSAEPASKAEPEGSVKISNYKEKKIDVPISSLMESAEFLGQEPRKELQYFLSRVLIIIRSVTNTRTAAFLFVNFDKKQLVLESFVSEVPDSITTSRKLPLGGDVVSQIIKNVKPEILTDIEPAAELDLIPYYTKQVGINSFIGVPVFFNGTVIGILCADTAVSDAYDAVTVSFFGHFAKIIGSLVQSYTEKYDLMQASKTLDLISQFRQVACDKAISDSAIRDSLLGAVSGICDYNQIGVIMYDDDSERWLIKSLRAKDESYGKIAGRAVRLEKTVVGEAFYSARTMFLMPVVKEIIKLYPGEPVTDAGFFAAFPLKSISHNYGVLFVEGKSQSGISHNDIKIIETLCQHAGTAFEQLYFNKVFQNNSMLDASTGLMNSTAFVSRMEEELLRSRDFNIPLFVCFFQIDRYASFDPKTHHDRLKLVLEHVVRIAKKNLRAYDVFGSVDDKVYGVGLIGMSLQDARLWAERLRSEVAITALQIEKQRFTVTISIGLAEPKKNANIFTVFDNARRALEISQKKMNTLTVFS